MSWIKEVCERGHTTYHWDGGDMGDRYGCSECRSLLEQKLRDSRKRIMEMLDELKVLVGQIGEEAND